MANTLVVIVKIASMFLVMLAGWWPAAAATWMVRSPPSSVP